MFETCYAQAHAPLPLPAGHARMPPGPGKSVTELDERGFDAPPPGFHGRQAHIARLTRRSKWNVAGQAKGPAASIGHDPNQQNALNEALGDRLHIAFSGAAPSLLGCARPLRLPF